MTTHSDDDIIALSRQKWQWMSDRQIEPLEDLFHDAAVFVHMGATMTKDAEIEVIRSGQIHYKDIDIEEMSVRFVGDTAVVLPRCSWVPWSAATRSPTRSSSPRSTFCSAEIGSWRHCPSPDC